MLLYEIVMVAMSAVRAVPPNDAWSNRVNFESRYGTWGRRSASALTQFPSALSPRLMARDSSNRL